MKRASAVFRAKDLPKRGHSRDQIRSLLRQGRIERVGRGLYRWAGMAPGEHESALTVMQRVPDAVICLLSALRFHEIGTQDPPQVWIGIDRKARKPAAGEVPVRVVRLEGMSARRGIEKRLVGGATLRVTNPARTVIDCFRYRRKIGLDVALEALEDSVRRRIVSRDELVRMARAFRMAVVMRPYLEALSR